MHIAQGMPHARRAGGASAARNGHRTNWRGQWPAEEGGTELEAEAEEDELEGKLAEEGELAGAAELEAKEGELEGPVQHAMDTEDELEGSMASGGGWHGAGGRGRGGRAGGGQHGAGGG